MQQRDITILGGGFSGSMLAVQLAHLRQPLAGTVHIVEPRPVLGAGLAYLDRRPEHLLNVRTVNLSAFPDQPSHFAAWLEATGAATCEHDYCPRQTYGRYMQALTAAILAAPAANGLTFRWHQQAALGVEVATDGCQATVRLADGTEIRSDTVVLALGNFPPPSPAGPGAYLAHPGFHGNPWAAGALRGIGPDDEVLLIGSGLTAVDVLLGLRADGHRAPVTVVSRHQRCPVSHQLPAAPYPDFYETRLRGLGTVGEVLAVVRHQVRQAAAQGIPWRYVFDSLRPHLGAIWAAWPLAEQARFLRHLASLWSVLRHRSPPQNEAAVRGMMATGQVRMRAGRVHGLEAAGESLRVRIGQGGQTDLLTVRHVINCTGPLLDYTRIQDPMVMGLRAAGHLQTDPLRLGILTDEHGALLDAAGRTSRLLFTLGPSRRPAYFESTAVPELRQQAVALAQELGCRWRGL
ncbi:MAG: FAD/NAD(P)-binding protein [Hymenobacter sp.]|nr:FAD/NAD(P)-binding protein [Hymenobacter sp.]